MVHLLRLGLTLEEWSLSRYYYSKNKGTVKRYIRVDFGVQTFF